LSEEMMRSSTNEMVLGDSTPWLRSLLRTMVGVLPPEVAYLLTYFLDPIDTTPLRVVSGEQQSVTAGSGDVLWHSEMRRASERVEKIWYEEQPAMLAKLVAPLNKALADQLQKWLGESEERKRQKRDRAMQAGASKARLLYDQIVAQSNTEELYRLCPSAAQVDRVADVFFNGTLQELQQALRGADVHLVASVYRRYVKRCAPVINKKHRIFVLFTQITTDLRQIKTLREVPEITKEEIDWIGLLEPEFAQNVLFGVLSLLRIASEVQQRKGGNRMNLRDLCRIWGTSLMCTNDPMLIVQLTGLLEPPVNSLTYLVEFKDQCFRP